MEQSEEHELVHDGACEGVSTTPTRADGGSASCAHRPYAFASSIHLEPERHLATLSRRLDQLEPCTTVEHRELAERLFVARSLAEQDLPISIPNSALSPEQAEERRAFITRARQRFAEITDRGEAREQLRPPTFNPTNVSVEASSRSLAATRNSSIQIPQKGSAFAKERAQRTTDTREGGTHEER